MKEEIPAAPNRGGLSSNAIKLIAIFAMTVDHVTWAIFPGCQHSFLIMALHVVGRLTAPIMWFFIAEGFHYTRNRVKYGERLFFFAILSHFAYNFAGGIPFLPRSMFNGTSVMWSLAWSVVLMGCFESKKYPQGAKVVFSLIVCLITFPSDWSCIAAMCPAFLYSHRGDFKKQAMDIGFWTLLYAIVYFFAIDRVYGVIQMCTLLSIPILRLYNGTRGSFRGMKWFFYLYYPGHLIMVGLLRLFLGRGPIFP